MNSQALSIGLIVPYILGALLIVAICVKLFTKKPPSNIQTSVFLVIAFALIALPIASKITIDIKGIRIDLETATQQVTELQHQISDLKNENAGLINQINLLNSQITVFSDPNANQIQRNSAALNLSSGISLISSRLNRVRSTLDSAEVKSNEVMNNLTRIKTRKGIIR
jgi:hypothetical protein